MFLFSIFVILLVAAMFAFRDREKPICQCCKKTEDLMYGPHPTWLELNNDRTPVWLCKECREDFFYEI